jgi:HlyD family secretion protein
VATKLGGRVQEILVAEGEFVKAGQLLARMQIDSLQAQRDEAIARQQQAEYAVKGAEAQVALRESDLQATQALVVQRESELDAAQRRLARSKPCSKKVHRPARNSMMIARVSAVPPPHLRPPKRRCVRQMQR